MQTLQKEHDITHQVLSKLRDAPNQNLISLESDIANLTDKLQPMLEKVEQAQRNIELARATHGGTLSGSGNTAVSMLSKMGGRYIHYNADKLTEMLLDDILADTVFELQDIEHKMKTKVVENESQALAANLL